MLASFVTAMFFAFVAADTVLAIRYSAPPPEPGWIGATGKPGYQESEYFASGEEEANPGETDGEWTLVNRKAKRHQAGREGGTGHGLPEFEIED